MEEITNILERIRRLKRDFLLNLAELESELLELSNKVNKEKEGE